MVSRMVLVERSKSVERPRTSVDRPIIWTGPIGHQVPSHTGCDGTLNVHIRVLPWVLRSPFSRGPVTLPSTSPSLTLYTHQDGTHVLIWKDRSHPQTRPLDPPVPTLTIQLESDTLLPGSYGPL